ncbi:MAG: hypothetical protein HPY84_08335 [Syntrophobacteraceae bacterium]|nr:hypothetical protein [Syntrophobacteraceae bacterium]
MVNNPKGYFGIALLLSLFWIFAVGPCPSAAARDETKLGAFFSQGQTLHDLHDQEKSRQEAIRDFLVQAVIQALGYYMSPSQVGTRYTEIRKKILQQPERYVDNYQIFSEIPGDGVYRVIGQVAVSLDVLRNDLVQTGLLKEQPDVAALPADGKSDRPAAEAGEPGRAGESPGGKSPVDEAVPGSAAEDTRDVLWAVAEKWEQEWMLPENLPERQGLFASIASQELADYRLTPRLPEPGDIRMDSGGNVPVNRAVSHAKDTGIPSVVVGAVALKRMGSHPPVLEVNLRVLDVSSGRSLGHIRKERTLEEASNQEGAMEIAAEVVPQLAALLNASSSTEAESQAVVSDKPGEWILRIRSDQQFAYWREMEKGLRERARGLKVRSIEMGADENLIRIDGVDGQSLMAMNGTPLPSGVQVKIEALSGDPPSARVSFLAQGTSPPGAAQ